MPSIKIVTLNVGRGFPGFMSTLEFLDACMADVYCLQDLRREHIRYFDEFMNVIGEHFVPMTAHIFPKAEGEFSDDVGIGIFAAGNSLISTSAHAYWGSVSPVWEIGGVEYGPGGNARPVDLEAVRRTESRLVAFAEIEKGGHVFKIGTTHGVWVPGGKADDHQRKCMRKCRDILAREPGPFIVAGDWNAARGGEIYDMLTEDEIGSAGLVDCTPVAIENTVDWTKRGKQGPNLVVDYILAKGSPLYEVTDVEAHFGVSDHAAITATVSVRE
ncbi:MAG TPA: endonuclease/exonuclease/phosphatase family protein [Candidatus Paceibacterota bacterium]|nr:endonuclease/exonuclease/phosphatase family protein [Candidatus Paceibacterota bacterium]